MIGSKEWKGEYRNLLTHYMTKPNVRLVRAWLMLAACWDSWKGQMGGPLTDQTAKNLK